MFRCPFLVLCLLFTSLPFAQAFDQVEPRNDPGFLNKSALEIDKLIADFYRRKQLSVPQVIDDATFMRRAFLVAIGRIPTVEEGLAFIEIENPDKRADLVGYLFNAPGYSSHMTNWAFDLLRLRDTPIGSPVINEPYRNWIRQAMTQNMPWDEFVADLLSSEGNGWAPESAAVGYYTSDRGMPLDNLANTMRVFLGSRMECAQCHDDPFGETERMDFYHLAAFTNGQAMSKRHLMYGLWNELREDLEENRFEYEVGLLLWNRVYGMSLAGGGKGRIPLPSDYQYRDGNAGELVGGRTPFGKMVRTSDRRDDGEGRMEFTKWIIEKTGPQFSGVIANRMWERVMGKGIYEPVDDYIVPSETVYPELITFIGDLMLQLDYDLRAFQQVLMLTKTFQFETNPNPSTESRGDDFHGRKIERLSAEQIWDSLITLSDGDPDKQSRRDMDTRVFVGGSPVLVGKMDMIRLSEEVMALESEKEVREYFRELCKIIESSGKDMKSGAQMSMMMGAVKKYGRDAAVRASELPSPAPREHFLYLFGASDREVVEAASREANVGQMLAMMNGFVQRKLVNNPQAYLFKNLEGGSSATEKIRRLYVAILNRPPTKTEMTWMKAEVEAQGEEGFRNIAAALVMSSEFVFLR